MLCYMNVSFEKFIIDRMLLPQAAPHNINNDFNLIVSQLFTAIMFNRNSAKPLYKATSYYY